MPPPAKLSSAGIFQKQSQAPVVRQINTHIHSHPHPHTHIHIHKTEVALQKYNTTLNNEIKRDSPKCYHDYQQNPSYYTSVCTHYINIMHWIKGFFRLPLIVLKTSHVRNFEFFKRDFQLRCRKPGWRQSKNS